MGSALTANFQSLAPIPIFILKAIDHSWWLPCIVFRCSLSWTSWMQRLRWWWWVAVSHWSQTYTLLYTLADSEVCKWNTSYWFSSRICIGNTSQMPSCTIFCTGKTITFLRDSTTSSKGSIHLRFCMLAPLPIPQLSWGWAPLRNVPSCQGGTTVS